MNTSTDDSTTVRATPEPAVPETAGAGAPVLHTTAPAAAADQATPAAPADQAEAIAPVIPPAEGVGHPHETQTHHELAANPVGAAIGAAAGVAAGLLVGIAAGPVGSLAGAVFGGAAGAMIGARGMSAAGERAQMQDDGSPFPGPEVPEVIPPAQTAGPPHETQTHHELAGNPVGATIGAVAGVSAGLLAGIAAGPVGSLAGAVFGGAAGAMLGARGMSAAGERAQLPDDGSALPGPEVPETLPTPAGGGAERGPGGTAPGVEPAKGPGR